MIISDTILNIIKKRLFTSICILFIIRFGTYLPVPGIKQEDLFLYLQQHSFAKTFIQTFYNSKTFVIGLFTLNIFPYINATILVQIMLSFSSQLSKIQKEGDLEGRRSINQLTRLITLILIIIQSISISLYLKQILLNWNLILAFEIIIWLTTGSMIVLWLSELITDYGFGNGASLLIYTNIISNIPTLFMKLLFENNTEVTILSVSSLILLLFGTLYAIIFLQKGIRKIPLISSKQLNSKSISTRNDYFLPLKLNQAGVMPIVLTTTLLVIPNYLINLGIFPWLNFLNSFKFIYWFGYFGLILLSSFFYSFIAVNPKDISDQFQKMAVTIENKRPGLQTTLYLKHVIQRITLIGSLMLALITLVPNFLESTLNILNFNGISSTSFLILAGVILDLRREIQNIYYSNIYNKKLK